MSAPVDVLAVMDTVVARAKVSLSKSLREAEKAAEKKGEPCPHSTRMVEVKQHWLAEKQAARAAVADLLYAAKRIRLGYDLGVPYVIGVADLHDALDRIGGEA